MPYEFWSAAAAVGTFIVISATAISAMIQLRHLRANNELHAALSLFAQKETAEMQQRFSFVGEVLAGKMQDASFRAGYSKTPVDRQVHLEMFVCDFYEQLGQVILNGLVDEKVILMQESYRIVAFWDLLEPSIAIMRRSGDSAYWQFEFLTTRARKFLAQFATLPEAKFQRIEIKDPWLSADQMESQTH